MYQNNSYDIIFMDIQMPIMSGVEATEKIIEWESKNSKKHTPIVALTANVISGDKEKYLSAGMDRYLKKPIEVDELTNILEEYFPIHNIRESIPLDNQKEIETQKQSRIILYKETDLTAKIYSAVLNNLGYKVDMYSSKDEFLEHLDRNYKFALFDIKPFQRVNRDDFVINLIKSSGTTPIAFVDNDEYNLACEIINQMGNVTEISQKLKKCG
jgi:CheY-like chemotaxis protein